MRLEGPQGPAQAGLKGYHEFLDVLLNVIRSYWEALSMERCDKICVLFIILKGSQ